MKKLILILALMMASPSFAWQNPQPVPGNLTSGTVAVTSTVEATIPQGYLGLSYAKDKLNAPARFFSGTNARTVADFKDLGPGTLRLLTDDTEIWTPGGPGQTANQIAPSDIQALATFLQATGWKCTYGINYLTQSSSVSAAEALYVSEQLGSSLVGFEIGNEPDSAAYGGVTPAAFAAAWRTVALAIVNSVPAAKFIGPSTGVASSAGTWSSAMMAMNSDLIYWDSAHFYVDGPSTATMAEILNFSATADSYFASEANGIQSVQATYPQPWVINETSDVYSGGKDGVSDTYGAALYSLDFAFQAAQAGAYSVNFISGGLGKINNNPYSVIQDSAGTAFYPTARYAGLYLFYLATQNRAAKLVSTAINASGVNATAYTIANANGTFSTVIVNRSSTNLGMSLTLPRDVLSANILTLANSTGSVTDQAQADALIQGAPVQEAAPPSMGAPYTATITQGAATVYVPAYSAALVQSTQSDVVGTTLTIQAPNITYGSSATISVNVAADSGVPSGNVTLTVDGGAALTAPLSGGSATFTASALAAGTHPLGASYAAQGSYAAGSGSATLTVAQAPLTVTAADASRAYGAANPALTYTVAGFVNGDTSAVVSGAPGESTAATATSAPGAYPIVLSQGTLSAANYSFALVAGSFTITQASTKVALTAALVGNTATLTATATPQVSGVPGGAVAFMDGATALGSATLLNGMASFTTGVLPGGSNSLTAVYGGDANFSGATSNTVVEVLKKAIPPISWSAPGPIVYGTALSAAQLDATSSVPGSFVYTPAAGTIPTGGRHVLAATFTPANSAQYSTAKATVSLLVTKVNPAIVWPTPASIVYGTLLTGVQLNASASVPGVFTYSPAAGVLLAGGTHTLVARFAPTDSTDYAKVSSSVTITVNKATPQITWANPAAISHGTRLSSTQLNAKANVAGRFVYSPAAGTVLSTGTHTLTATFTPSYAADYNSATATVSITVN